MDLEELFGEVEKYGFNPIDYQYFNQLLNHRTIILNDDVSDSLLEKVILPLRDFEQDDINEPVTLVLQSSGGSVVDGLVLINIIDHYTKPLNIIVYGYAYSMCFAILCAGSKNPNVSKKCHRFTTALWHSGMTILQGETTTVKDIQEFNDRVDEDLKEYIIDNTLIPRNLYEKKERYQFYLDATELLKYGIVDEILYEAKMPEKCQRCLLRSSCENKMDYAFELGAKMECDEFEPDIESQRNISNNQS